jgi:hypothetical protein
MQPLVLKIVPRPFGAQKLEVEAPAEAISRAITALLASPPQASPDPAPAPAPVARPARARPKSKPPVLVERRCGFCSNTFRSTHNLQRYCSSRCKKKAGRLAHPSGNGVAATEARDTA